jgi:histidinol-phosphate phosphatase family protein
MKAVILAGGLGQRLKPLTDLMPKPMAPVNGNPFLLKIINQLIENDYEEILILAGYKSEILKSYLNKLDFKLKIKVISTPDYYSPKQRLLISKTEIGDKFILLYGDNYIENFQQYTSVESEQSPISLLVENRIEGNIKFLSNQEIRYISNKRNSDHQFVDLGYIKVNTSKFFSELERSEDLNVALESLSKDGLIKADIVGMNSNLSISNLSRFNQINRARKKILIDRDGIINVKMARRKYLSRFEDYKIIEENWLGLEKLSGLGCDFIIITNQPGISTGEVSVEFMQELHERIYLEFLQRNIYLYGIYVCPHHWDDQCSCRKPRPGMLNSALSDFDINKSETLYIGDELKDELAANAAGIKFMYVNSEQESFPTSVNVKVNTIMEVLSL